MTCLDCRALLTDYAHHQLDARSDAAVFEHAQSCAECRAQLSVEAALTEAVRAAFGQELELPTSVVANVRQMMRAERAPSALERLTIMLRPTIVAPVAAAILVAVVVGYNAAHPPAPALSADYYVRQHVAQTIGSPSSDPAWSVYLLTNANAQNQSDAAASPNG